MDKTTANHFQAVAVFGGNRVPRESAQYAEAYRVGALLAQSGFTVINGGYSGTMEASAKGAREAGGRVVGVTSTLFAQNVMNEFVDEEIPTDDLYNRIRELIMRGDAYIVLRGGIGTLAELQMVWNLASLDPDFNKPIVLLGAFWKNVIRIYQENLAIGPEHTRLLQFASTPEECMAWLARTLNHAAPESKHPLPPAPSP
jgi:uncharacterized protein (TIGR00730 family)